MPDHNHTVSGWRGSAAHEIFKIIESFRVYGFITVLYQFGTLAKSKLQDIYYSWYYRVTSKEGSFAIEKRNRSESHLELLENQEDSNTHGSMDIDEIVEYNSGNTSNDHLRLERNASTATQSSHLSP